MDVKILKYFVVSFLNNVTGKLLIEYQYKLLNDTDRVLRFLSNGTETQ